MRKIKERKKQTISLVLLVLLVVIHCRIAGGETIYVDVNSPNDIDGESWATAYKYLEDALADANSNSDPNDEIWVAKGTYNPDVGAGDPCGTGDANATFQLINDVTIYGGFAGGETSREQRDWQANKTILSGDLDGNDVQVDPCDLLSEPTRAENSYQVVTGSGTDGTAVLDGFTITAGNANGSSWPADTGGGMYNEDGSPTLTNCTFIGNSAGWSGGGMGNTGTAEPTLTNCTFSENSAGLGAGMMNRGAPTLTNCTFIGNYTDSGGGGMDNSGDPNLIKCAFIGNSAGIGGGMTDYGDPNLTNCMFSGNSATSYGGGMYSSSGDPNLTNCTFSGNSATNYGGGIYNGGSDLTLTNCILWGNTASNGPQIALNTEFFALHRLIPGCTVTVSYSNVQGGQAAVDVGFNSTLNWGGGNIEDDPLFVDANGDDLHLLVYSPCFNAGDPSGDYSGQTDIDDEPRVRYGNVDMGADEVFQIAGDFDLDEDVDWFDLDYFTDDWLENVFPPGGGGDLNKDGVVNFTDYSYLGWSWSRQFYVP